MSRAHWTIAYRNLARNRRRNFATGIAIALGFAAMTALAGYLHRVENYLRTYTLYAARVGHITIYKENGLDRYASKPALYSLDLHDLETIKAIVANHRESWGIELEGAQLKGTGLIGNGCRSFPFLAMGIDPQLDLQLRAHPEMTRWAPTLKDYTKGRGLWNYPPELGALAIGDGLTRFLHKSHVYDELPPEHKPVIVANCSAPDTNAKLGEDSNVQLAAGTWNGMLSALDGEVVATFNSGLIDLNNAAILMPLSRLQKLYDTDHATYYSLWLKNPQALPEVLAELKAQLKEQGLKVDLYTWRDEDVAPLYTGTMQFLYVMVGFIGVVLATVIVFSVFNSATMTIIERSQEIGMMRSLGYTRGQVRRLFLMEMALLSGASVVGGGALGAAFILIVNHSKIPFTPPGLAGRLYIMMVPDAPTVSAAAVMILVLAMLTTVVAIRNVVRRGIAALVAGTQR